MYLVQINKKSDSTAAAANAAKNKIKLEIND